LIRLLALLVSALAAVAVAACGGGDSTADTYKDDFPPINRRLVALGSEVGDTIGNAGSSTDQELADDLGREARQLGDLQQQLDDLDPPEDLAGDQDALVSAMDAAQGDLNAIAAAVRDGDVGAAREATRKLIRDSNDLRDSRRRLAAAVAKL
jgi:hypothetical protein